MEVVRKTRKPGVKWNVSSVRRAQASPGHRLKTPQNIDPKKLELRRTTNYHKYIYWTR